MDALLASSTRRFRGLHFLMNVWRLRKKPQQTECIGTHSVEERLDEEVVARQKKILFSKMCICKEANVCVQRCVFKCVCVRRALDGPHRVVEPLCPCVPWHNNHPVLKNASHGRAHVRKYLRATVTGRSQKTLPILFPRPKKIPLTKRKSKNSEQ